MAEKIEDGRVLQSPFDEYAPGSLVEAGLPDHSHTTKVSVAMTTIRPLSGSYISESIKSDNVVSTLASAYDPIYGNSATVQPPALIVNIWKRIS